MAVSTQERAPRGAKPETTIIGAPALGRPAEVAPFTVRLGEPVAKPLGTPTTLGGASEEQAPQPVIKGVK